MFRSIGFFYWTLNDNSFKTGSLFNDYLGDSDKRAELLAPFPSTTITQLQASWSRYAKEVKGTVTPSGYSGQPVTWAVFWSSQQVWYVTYGIAKNHVHDPRESRVRLPPQAAAWAWLREASDPAAVAFWERLLALMELAAGPSYEQAGMRCPAFYHGARPPQGAEAHYDDYDNVATLVCGRKWVWLLEPERAPPAPPPVARA